MQPSTVKSGDYIRVIYLREHIELRGNDPLEAIIAGTHHQAYLVANLALIDGPQASADHYSIPLANVYGAMAFYYENEGAIREARELGVQMGVRSAQAVLEEIMGRQKAR